MRGATILLLVSMLVVPACAGHDDDEGRAPDVTVATLNILHGLACPRDTDNCRLPNRIDLLFKWIQASGCPDVVTLQEVWRPIPDLAAPYLNTTCPFTYQTFIRSGQIGPDEEFLLSRYPIAHTEILFLYPGFRRVLFARIDHPTGPLDVFSTHLASTSDGAQNACGLTAPCPDECVAAGAANVRECQAVQMAQFIESHHDIAGPALITGDFNDPPGSFVYEQFVGRGWTDAYLAAGNPECDEDSGVGCTSGRVDDALTQLESPASNEFERIDFIFVVPPASGSSCQGRIDSGTDGDGDGVATKIFAGEPNPFAPACGALPDSICWPSDHEGMQLDLNCD